MKQLSSSELNGMSKEELAAMVLQVQQQIHTLNEKIAIMNAYLKHLLTEIPKHMDETNMEFLEDLLPWSENLPEDCHKRI